MAASYDVPYDRTMAELFDETFLDTLDPEEWDLEKVRIHNRTYAEAMRDGQWDIVEHLTQNTHALRRGHVPSSTFP